MQSLNKAEGKVNDSLLTAVYKVKIFLLILSSLISVCAEADNGQRKETPVQTAHVGEQEDTGRFGSKTQLITIRELLKCTIWPCSINRIQKYLFVLRCINMRIAYRVRS